MRAGRGVTALLAATLAPMLAPILAATLASTLAWAAPVTAAPLPVLFPTHDVAVTYLVRGSLDPHGQRRTLRVTARWNAAAERLRLSAGAAAQGYDLLVDFPRQRMMAVNPAAQLAMQLPMAVPVRPGAYTPPPGDRVRATGTETILGRPCTDWSWHGARGSGTACVTADGLILRAQGHGAGNGVAPQGIALAVAVRDGPEPLALFRLGPGVHRIDLSHIQLGSGPSPRP